MTGEPASPVSFDAHVGLLERFLARRREIVERIQGLLNAQRKPAQYLQDRHALSRDLDDCFFVRAELSGDQLALLGQLEHAHWTAGFRPRKVPGLHNDVIHPVEMMIRGFYFWQHTRWPGRNGRVGYAHTLFNLYVLRCLVLLSMRLWDAGQSAASDRLAQVQRLLDALWQGSPGDQPVFVRDARWLVPLAQSPTTDELAAYFDVAKHVAEVDDEATRVEMLKAGVAMIAGHLRAQIRHYCTKEGLSIGDRSVILRTRTSNALDFALLIQGLVVLLEAYESAIDQGDGERRLELAGAILQGVSPDPEVFLRRADLLAAYSMIEHLFVATDRNGEAGYTAMGQRHIELVRRYESLIGRSSRALYRDAARFRPADGTWSPYGAIYGTPTNLVEDMALKSMQPGTAAPFSLEDVFVDGGAEKLAWVNGWRKLPHVDVEVQKLYDYPRWFADEIFDRIEHELRLCVERDEASELPRTGRVFVITEDEPEAGQPVASMPELSPRYIGSSDREMLAAGKAEAYDEAQLLRDRLEGHFALSYETQGGWAAINKDFLTDVLGAGHDARIVGLPVAAAGTLRLMCPGLVVLAGRSSRDQASVPPSIVKA